jgi:prophage regulatory protein
MKPLPTTTGLVLNVRPAKRNRSGGDEAAEQSAMPVEIVATRSAPLALPRLLRFAAVRELTGLSRSTVWRLEQSGLFPKHRRISSHAVAWVEDEIMTWIRSKVDSLSA